MRWRRERNMRWTRFSDTDPTIVHLAYSPRGRDIRSCRHLRASPCVSMQMLGQGYGEPTDDEANCIACFANEPDDESLREDADG